MNGNNLDVGLNGFGVVGTAFINTPVTLTQTTSFIASYNFTMSNDGSQTTLFFQPYEGNGGSFEFIVQNCGGASYTLGGDCSQIRSSFNADEGFPQNPVIPFGSTDIELNGGLGPDSPQQQFNLHNSLSLAGPGPYDVVTGTATDSYDSTTNLFRVQASDSVGGSVDFSMSVNLYNLITQGNPPAAATAFFGFGGSSNGGRANTEFSNFSLTLVDGALPTGPVGSAPEPATMLLCVAGFGLLLLRRP
jgi:hypothetical protein